MKKGFWWIILIVFLALIVFRVVQKQSRKGIAEVKESAPTQVVVEAVKRDTLISTISYSGNITGKEHVNVYPMEETGRLIKYTVKEGDRVSKGSVIAIVDRSIKGMSFQPAKITSPISGIVGMLFLDKGATVAPQIPLAMIVNMDEVKVEIQILEDDLLRVRKGQNAFVKVDLYPDTVFEGNLKEITPVVNPLSRTAKGQIIIDNPKHLLKPGMFTRVEIIIEKHIDALVVPEKAVLKREGKEIVFIRDGDIAIAKEVKTGIKTEGKIEILSGVEKGESVIVLGNYGLRDGQRIRVESRER
mgnify:CR=1 FL=1